MGATEAGKRRTKRVNPNPKNTREDGTFKNNKYTRTYNIHSEALLNLDEFQKCGDERISMKQLHLG